MTKYNAILLEKHAPKPTRRPGCISYMGTFYIAVENNTDYIEITASQLKPIPAEVGDEIILEVNEVLAGSKLFYNINTYRSYARVPFPVITHRGYYSVTLDANGYDSYSEQSFPDHPYADVKMCCTTTFTYNPTEVNFNTTRVVTIAEILTKIDYTAIHNVHPNLEQWIPTGYSDQERLWEALRDYLPIKEHPDKHSYTPAEIFSHYRECSYERIKELGDGSVYQYGSDANHCICGHYIEDVRFCEYVSPNGPSGIMRLPLGAIGNCCIEQMSYGAKLYTRLLHNVIVAYAAGKFQTERDVSKKNGFGALQMHFLQQCVLTHDEMVQLEEILKSRTKKPLTMSFMRILYHISQFYNVYYNYIFD